MVQHPAVLELVGRGDPGTRPRLHVVQGQPMVAYSSTRVFMKRDAWDMLPSDGILVQWVRPSGESPWAIALTRGELEDVFGEIQQSESWEEARCYHFPQVPAAALSFRVLSATRPAPSAPRAVRRRKAAPRIHALLANYAIYDVEAAARSLSDDTWSLPRGDANPGDRLVFWRTRGPGGKRGVVAFGRVTDAPRLRTVPMVSHRFWRGDIPDGPHRRVGFTYLPAGGLPLWLDEDSSGVLASLSVGRAQGNKLYKVSEQAWGALWTMATGAAAPAPTETPSVVATPPAAPEPVAIEDLAKRVVGHLREYGSATEAELTLMAGGARRYRRLRRHLARIDAPLRIEATEGGSLWRWAGTP